METLETQTEETVNRGPSVFASKTKIGERYLTRGGSAIEIVTPDMKGNLLVRDLLRDVTLKIPGDHLLYPYRKDQINKEAIAMAKAEKKAGSTGGTKEKEAKGPDRGAARKGSHIVLFRRIKDTVHEVTFTGKVLEYKGKEYASLKEVASVIRGKAISGSGRSFFGLRHNGCIELGREVIKGLDDAKPVKEPKKPAVKKPKAAKQAKKAKSAKDEDGEDEGPESKPSASVGEAVSKVFGRGR